MPRLNRGCMIITFTLAICKSRLPMDDLSVYNILLSCRSAIPSLSQMGVFMFIIIYTARCQSTLETSNLFCISPARRPWGCRYDRNTQSLEPSTRHRQVADVPNPHKKGN